LKAMARAVTPKTKMVFIGNPDNPAGTYVTRPELMRFFQAIPQRVMVFMDEAYYEYAQCHRDYPDGVRLLRRFKNLIVSRTFSKMYGLAGLRIGYGIADPAVIDIIDRVREPFNVNSVAQAAALACLQDRDFYTRMAQRIESQRLYFYRRLRALGIDFIPTATNFILIRTDQDSRVVTRKLLQQGIIVRDMAVWGLERFIRVSIGTQTENQKILKILTRLQKD